MNKMTTDELFLALQHYLGEDAFFEELVAVIGKRKLRIYLDLIIETYDTDYEDLKHYLL